MKAHSAAIIPAAGSGSRMNSDIAKQFLELAGKPILVHTVAAFVKSACIDRIVVVVPAEMVAASELLFRQHNLLVPELSVIAGGRRRQDSVFAGLASLDEEIEVVLVHDGARPLISQELIARCHRQVLLDGAAIAAVQVKDTLKRGDEDFLVRATIDREALWQAQTPQGARRQLLLSAYAAAADREVTDEASLLEHSGIAVRLVPGEQTNIKITRPEDLDLAALLMKTLRPAGRIGHGYDAHRFAEGRRLVLGGVTIPHPRGLAGHSDADVLTHALCDAILGASGNGDIGRHFPDSDGAFKDILSLSLLDRVIALAADQGLALVNADITVVCQAPKLAPYIDKMRQNLARHCRTTGELINIKATTTEKMGFTGREEGISCHAVVLLGALT